MAYTTFSQTKNDQLKEPMFFGQPVNVARYDQQKYDIFEKLIEKQLSFFWRPEEVDVSRDRIDYQALPEHEKHIFISNLKYQTLLDSIQGRSPNVALLPLISIPELETWVETWAFSETIHSRCVVANDGPQGLLVDPQAALLQAVFLHLLGQQVILGDLQLFLIGIAGKLNDFHPVQQGPGNRIQRVGRGNEHHLRKVQRNF